MKPAPRYLLPPKAYVLACLALLSGCGEAPEHESPRAAAGRSAEDAVAETRTKTGNAFKDFIRVGEVTAAALDEISGIQAGEGKDWLVHTDDGAPVIHVIDTQGLVQANVALKGSKNQDWEDVTSIPGTEGPLLVIADSGDNHALRKHIRLLFYPLPVRNAAGKLPGSLDLLHDIKLRFPDGPKDCEAVAFDPASQSILLITKRDVPPRIYGIGVQRALSESDAELEFLGETAKLRPPTPMDVFKDPGRGPWISQPTGMDISADGKLLAIITYRSLYLFHRAAQETWPQALFRKPVEIVGPPGYHDEAVGFSRDQTRLLVTGENLPAAIYQLDLTSGVANQPGSMP